LTPERLRTLQIGNDWFGERQGGLNRVYSELVKYLPSVSVGVRGMVAGTEQAERDTGGAVRAFATPTEPLAERVFKARRLGLKILKEQKTDLIASHFALYGFSILDRMGRMPTVIHFHGPWAAEAGVEGKSSLGSRAQAAIERAVYARGRRVIVLSRAFANELAQKYGVPEEGVRIVPGGVDAQRFNDRLTRREAREQLGWPTDRPIVLAVRRHTRRMGLENLIDAAKEVSRVAPDVLVLLGGTGVISDELRQRVVDRGVERNLRLVGRIEDSDLPIAYRAADMSIVPSQALEGFGMITLESLASGTPVIVTPVGGLPEVVRPFAPQCVLEGTTTEIIAGALCEFIRGKRELPASEACRAYAEKNFSWPVIAELTRRVYEEAME